MNIWKIWNSELPELDIEANSFDEALEKARKINPNYNYGQLQTKYNEYDDIRRQHISPDLGLILM